MKNIKFVFIFDGTVSAEETLPLMARHVAPINLALSRSRGVFLALPNKDKGFS